MMLFVCNETTLKRLWQRDTDVRVEHIESYFSRPKSIDQWWLYNDVDYWQDFIKNAQNSDIIQKLESRSMLDNTTPAWKSPRTWKRVVRK